MLQNIRINLNKEKSIIEGEKIKFELENLGFHLIKTIMKFNTVILIYKLED